MKRALAERASKSGAAHHLHHHPSRQGKGPGPARSHINASESLTNSIGGVLTTSPTNQSDYLMTQNRSSECSSGSNIIHENGNNPSTKTNAIHSSPSNTHTMTHDNSDIQAVPLVPQAKLTPKDMTTGGSLSSPVPERASSAGDGQHKRKRGHQDTPVQRNDDKRRKRQDSAKRSKRMRKLLSYSSASSGDENEDDPERNAFYLRHQNRALASELFSHKRQIALLLKEREYRRKQCQEARDKIEKAEGLWRGSVAGLISFLNHIGALSKEKLMQPVFQKRKDATKEFTFEEISTSTGEGKNVETIPSLIGSLQSLIKALDSSDITATPKIKAETTSAPSVVFSSAEVTTPITARSSSPLTLSSPHVTLPDSCHSSEETPTAISIKTEDEHLQDEKILGSEERHLDEISRMATATNDRAKSLDETLSDWIHSFSRPLLGIENSTVTIASALETSKLHRRITSLERKIQEHDTITKELSSARDEAKKSEKNLQRILCRLASGRLSVEDVKKDIEKDGGTLLIDEGVPVDSSASCPRVVSDGVVSGVISASSLSSGDTVTSATSPDRPYHLDAGNAEKADISVAAELKRRIQELETVSECRNERIKELLCEREEQLKRINSLLHSSPKSAETNVSSPNSDEVKRSEAYLGITAKLVTTERKISNLKAKLEKVTEQWASAKGDVQLANKAMEEMRERHTRQWNELSNFNTVIHSSCESENLCRDGQKIDEVSISEGGHADEPFEVAKKLIYLEHKLQQALEGASHAESLRIALAEARKMNDSLHDKVSELKAKYQAATASKSSRGSSDSSSHKSSSHSSSSREASYERLKTDFRKVRKELLAANLSKENYKNKFEKSEKERESATKANARLFKQSAEKEEMNAKSLSTILHLKQLSELRTKEIETLEQKVKSAEQLALSARLAANAKQRIEEEVLKEKKLVEEQLIQTLNDLDSLRAEKDQVDCRLSETKSQMVSVVKDLKVVRERCDELSAESTTVQVEKSQLLECLAVAKKDAIECSKKAAAASAPSNSSSRSRGAIGSDFTVDQLNTHLNVLKGRLACPVCNDREKQCILLRCRHMFCKHCIDENIKNRSRKCPACAQRFDMKDVGDVWL